jgi:hypothetical protein
MRQKNQWELNLGTGATGEARSTAAQATEARAARSAIESQSHRKMTADAEVMPVIRVGRGRQGEANAGVRQSSPDRERSIWRDRVGRHQGTSGWDYPSAKLLFPGGSRGQASPQVARRSPRCFGTRRRSPSLAFKRGLAKRLIRSRAAVSSSMAECVPRQTDVSAPVRGE